MHRPSYLEIPRLKTIHFDLVKKFDEDRYSFWVLERLAMFLCHINILSPHTKDPTGRRKLVLMRRTSVYRPFLTIRAVCLAFDSRGSTLGALCVCQGTRLNAENLVCG